MSDKIKSGQRVYWMSHNHKPCEGTLITFLRGDKQALIEMDNGQLIKMRHTEELITAERRTS